MQIDIQVRKFQLTDAIYNHIVRRLHFALSAWDDQIMRVMVWLSDINGPRGGANKCCHIQVMIPHHSDIVIKDTETDYYVAIDRAADRVGRTVARRLARHRSIDRSTGSYEL
jgi:putative sigma-54 modulation protein